MTLFPKWFSRTKTLPSKPVPVTVGLIGPPNVGKTVLLDQIHADVFQNPLPSGLMLTPASPRQLVELLRHARGSEQILRSRSLESTQLPQKHLYGLYQGKHEQVRVLLNDARGQLLLCGRRTSRENHDDYEQYLGRLAHSDVLWLMVPCLPASPTRQDIQSFKDHFAVTTAYAWEALRRRSAGHDCVIALVINRIDIRYSSPSDSQTRLSSELIPWVLRQARRLAQHNNVAEVAVFPVSALGFGTTQVRHSQRAQNTTWIKSGSRQNEPEWLLKPDAVPRPYNLRTLLMWSLLKALENKQIDRLEQPVEAVAELCQRLHGDLNDGNPWYIPVNAG